MLFRRNHQRATNRRMDRQPQNQTPRAGRLARVVGVRCDGTDRIGMACLLDSPHGGRRAGGLLRDGANPQPLLLKLGAILSLVSEPAESLWQVAFLSPHLRRTRYPTASAQAPFSQVVV